MLAIDLTVGTPQLVNDLKLEALKKTKKNLPPFPF